MKIVAICGSLRAKSSNRSVLAAFARVAPPSVTIDHYDGLGWLPLFNPDCDREPLPEPVRALRACVGGADALVVSTPEYAHALPGAFKNALDWLVSDPTFVGKPVAILHISRGSTWARDSLREVLGTMSAYLVEPACLDLKLGSNLLEEREILERRDLRERVVDSMTALIHAIYAKKCSD